MTDPFAQCDGEEVCSGDPFDDATGNAFAQCDGEEVCTVDPDNVFGITEVLSAFGMCEGDDIGLEGFKMEEDPTYIPDIYSETIAAYCDGYTDPTISDAVTAFSAYRYPLVFKLTSSRAIMLNYQTTAPYKIYAHLLDISGLGVVVLDSIETGFIDDDNLIQGLGCRLSDTSIVVKGYGYNWLVIGAENDVLTYTNTYINTVRSSASEIVRLDDTHFMQPITFLTSTSEIEGRKLAFFSVINGVVSVVNEIEVIPFNGSAGVFSSVVVNAHLVTIYYNIPTSVIQHVFSTYYLNDDYSVSSIIKHIRSNNIDGDWISPISTASLLRCDHPFYYLAGTLSSYGVYSFKVVNANTLVSLQGKPAWMSYPIPGIVNAMMALESNATEPPVLVAFTQNAILPAESKYDHRIAIFQGWTSHSSTINPYNPNDRGQSLYSYDFVFETGVESWKTGIDRVIETGVGSLLVFYTVVIGNAYSIKYKRITNLRV